jgi:hypothetical protein
MSNLVKFSRRRLVVGLLLLVAVAAIAAAAIYWPRRAGPFWDKYQRIQMRMTEQEVTDMLGPPTYKESFGGSFGASYYTWDEGKQRIVVQFDYCSDGTDLKWGVVEKQFLSPMMPVTSEKLQGF